MTKVNHVISCLLIIKKIVLLNVLIQEDAKIQLRCRRCTFFVTIISTSNNIAITQYHKDQWNQRWKKYRERVTNINIISAQRLHLSNKMIKMRDDFQKAESILAMHIRTERIDLNVYLHFRNVSNMNSLRCNCEWSHQMTKHVLMHCSNWLHLRSRMLQDADFLNYWINNEIYLYEMLTTNLLQAMLVRRAEQSHQHWQSSNSALLTRWAYTQSKSEAMTTRSSARWSLHIHRMTATSLHTCCNSYMTYTHIFFISSSFTCLCSLRLWNMMLST